MEKTLVNEEIPAREWQKKIDHVNLAEMMFTQMTIKSFRILGKIELLIIFYATCCTRIGKQQKGINVSLLVTEHFCIIFNFLRTLSDALQYGGFYHVWLYRWIYALQIEPAFFPGKHA